MGANIAEHAIVSLAEMLANNPTIQTQGMVPYLGTKLDVNWSYFAALMAGIIVFVSLASVLGLMAILKGPRSEPSQWVELRDRDIVHDHDHEDSGSVRNTLTSRDESLGV